MRQEDTAIGDVDENGNLRKTIPILFMQPFRNKDGEIDLTQKSYDLSKNLAMFAKMAYSWKHMHEIEPQVAQLRELLANPTSEQLGTLVRGKRGGRVMGPLNEFMTKKGLDTDTTALFNELADAYLYGTRFADLGSSKEGIDYTKAIMKAKKFYGGTTLGFAVIPSMGAIIAGNIGIYFEAGKDISYSRKNLSTSHYNLVANHDKFTALALFYKTYGEDPATALIESKSANWYAKIFTYRNMIYPLRRAHEVINDSILNAMALNWGIDTEGKLGTKGALVRLNDPSRNTEGIKSIWDATTLDKDGKLNIEGLDKNNYLDFREAARETYGHVLGSMSQDDLSRIDTNLLYNTMFQFRPWMPGVIRERFGSLQYDPTLQAARWGRYKAAFKEFQLTDTDIAKGYASLSYMTDIFLPNMAKFTLDLATFGVSSKLGLNGGKWTDANGIEHRARGNPDRAYRMYIKYMEDNPNLSRDKFTFNHFLEIKEGQMRAFTSEARAVLMFAMAMHLMGSGGGAGGQKEEPPYMANWFSRFMYKNMSKAEERLTNMWSPVQLINIAKNPIPLTGLLTRTVNTGLSGYQTVRDMITGQEEPSTHNPFSMYALQWIYGGQQAARLMEFYKKYEHPSSTFSR